VTPIFIKHSQDDLRKGVDCGECGRFVKVNRKRLNHTMLQYLTLLYGWEKQKPGEYIQGSRLRIHAVTNKEEHPLVQTGDYKILAVWGLVEIDPEQSGFVRINQLGIDFVEDRATVPGAVFLENYKNRFVGFDPDTEMVSYTTANNTSFDPGDL
jgi:hypothetical protein